MARGGGGGHSRKKKIWVIISLSYSSHYISYLRQSRKKCRNPICLRKKGTVGKPFHATVLKVLVGVEGSPYDYFFIIYKLCLFHLWIKGSKLEHGAMYWVKPVLWIRIRILGSVCFWTLRIRIIICTDRDPSIIKKIGRKTLISTVLWLLYGLFSLKNDVIVPSKSSKQKNLFFYFFVWHLEVHWPKEQDP